MKNCLLLWACFLMVTCCAQSTSKQLESIESVLWTQSDSALVLLERFSTDHELNSPRNKAYWALLYSIALDKNYFFEQSDSLIKVALDYYNSGKDPEKKMYAWYYYGLVCKNAQAYPKAIVAFEEAEQYAAQLHNYQYQGLISREKGMVFCATNNNAEFIRNIRLAVDFFDKAHSSGHYLYAKHSLATAYLNDHQYDKADSVFQEVLASTEKPTLVQSSLLMRAQIVLDTDRNPMDAVNIYSKVPTERYTLLDFPYRAYAMNKIGNHNQANYWLQRGYEYSADQADSATVASVHARILCDRGQYKQAYHLLENAVEIQDSLVRTLLYQSVSNAQRDYYQQTTALKNESLKRVRQTSRLIGVALLLVLSLTAVLVLGSLRKKNEVLKEQMAQLAISEKDKQFLQKENAILIGSMFRNKFVQLNQLSLEYYEADDQNKKEIVFDSFKTYLNGIRNNEALFDDLASDLNQYCNGIINKLKAQVPQIKGEHLKTISLFFAGVPYNTIQLIMGAPSIEALKMARSRYRSMIKKANAIDADLFLDMLDMRKRQ